jgi:hypothetical protein
MGLGVSDFAVHGGRSVVREYRPPIVEAGEVEILCIERIRMPT